MRLQSSCITRHGTTYLGRPDTLATAVDDPNSTVLLIANGSQPASQAHAAIRLDSVQFPLGSWRICADHGVHLCLLTFGMSPECGYARPTMLYADAKEYACNPGPD